MSVTDKPARFWLDDSRVRYCVDVARAVLAAVLVAQIAVGLWHLSLRGDLPALVGALRAGTVTVLEIGEAPAIRPLGGNTSEVFIRWRTADGTWHAFSGDDIEVVGSYQLPNAEPGANDVPAGGVKVLELIGDDQTVARTIARAYATHHDTTALRSTADNPIQSVLDLGGSIVWLLALIILVTGPRPGRATKWGWFWLLFIDLNLGALAYLAMEAPWTRPRPTERRLSGWQGFTVAFVAAIALGMSSVGLTLL